MPHLAFCYFMLRNRPTIQIQSPSSSVNSSRLSLAERLSARLASKTESECPSWSQDQNLDPNLPFAATPTQIVFGAWKQIYLSERTAQALPIVIQRLRKRQGLKRLTSAIQIRTKQKLLLIRCRRNAGREVFERMKGSIVGRRGWQLEMAMKQTRKQQGFRDLIMVINATAKFEYYLKQLELNRYFSAFKQLTQQQRKVRCYRINSNKDLLRRTFDILKNRVQLQAKAVAMAEVKAVDSCFNVFSAWKTIFLSKKLIRFNQQQLIEQRSYKLKVQFLAALKNHQSLSELSFIKQRQAQRYNHLRQYSVFYPMMAILREMQIIRIKTIKLGVFLRKKRANELVKTAKKDFRSRQKQLRILGTQSRFKLLNQIYCRWKNITQNNFINRKQYQLSLIFHRAQLQKKSIHSLKQIVQNQRPNKEKLNKIKEDLKFSKKKEFIQGLKNDFLRENKVRKLNQMRAQNLKKRGFRQFRLNTQHSLQLTQDLWQLRKKTSTLTKSLNSHRKQLSFRLLLSCIHHRLSSLLLTHYASQLHNRHLLIICFKALSRD